MSDVYRTVTWGELGCPTEPVNVEYNGMVLAIKQSHIDAAESDPSAKFAVSRFVSHTGVHHRLGARTN
jgi:hypothetical protein